MYGRVICVIDKLHVQFVSFKLTYRVFLLKIYVYVFLKHMGVTVSN